MRKLQVGSGNTPWAGFEHLDINCNSPDLQYCCDFMSIPIESETFVEINASHCIEHVTFVQARKALREWYRLLRPGGLLVVDTPNLMRNVLAYIDGTWTVDYHTLQESEQRLCEFDGYADPDLWFSFKAFSTDANWNRHLWAGSYGLLAKTLIAEGYDRVRLIQSDPSLIVHGRRPGVATF
jgi:SAM-dependent methyltransferase